MVRDRKWRPREGRRFGAAESPTGKLERWMRFVPPTLERMQRILPNPAWGLVVGAAIAYVGRNDLVLRSIGLLLVVAWIAIDYWAWLLRVKDSIGLKYVAGWACTSVSLIALMATMFWGLDSKLQDQRDDAQLHLKADLPSEDVDPMHSVFVVNNDSNQVISRKHLLSCYVKLATGNNHGVQVKGLSFWEDEDGGVWEFGGIEAAIRRYRQKLSGTRIEPGGDAETHGCLRGLRFIFGTDCADVTLVFMYALETQPTMDQIKTFRFATHRTNDGTFNWQRKPIDDPKTYCEETKQP